MQIRILFFAVIKQTLGTSSIKLEVDEQTNIASLRKILEEKYPEHHGLFQHTLVAVNQNFVTEDDILHQNDEVAFFPPVSGGTDLPTICKITTRPLKIDNLVEKITLPTTGAVVTFTGVIRGITKRGHAHDTEALTYESYKPMALKKMAQIADEIRERWPAVEGIVLTQRIGTMEKKTVTVVISCSSPHRDDGVFEAARYGIDRLKEIVPVWKKEISSTGEVWIEGDYFPEAGE
jgi:molybdopterin synthase catalytic subunit